MSRVEFNWDIFPSTKLEAERMVGPIGCMFTPFDNPIGELSESNPIQCSTCQAIINQYARLDRQNREWWCPFCQKKTSLPAKFLLPEKGCIDSEVPLVIRPNAQGTVDYLLPHDITEPKFTGVFVAYVIDVYSYNAHPQAIDEFLALKLAIAKSIRKLSKETNVLILTFADKVHLHRGADISPIEIGLKVDETNTLPSIDLDVIKQKLDNSDAFSSPSDHLAEYVLTLQPVFTTSVKPERLTGFALLATCSIVETYVNSFALGKVLLFLSGPATLAPGKVVDTRSAIRSHQDILNQEAPFVASAMNFYRLLSLVSVGYSFDEASKAAQGKSTLSIIGKSRPRFTFEIFVGSADQVGLYEMKTLVEAGNGKISMNESFASKRFEDALISSLTDFESLNHNCTVTVLPSRGLRVLNATFNGTELESSHLTIKDLELHYERISDSITKYESSMKQRKFTNRWFMGSLNAQDTSAFFFEVDTVSKSSKLDSFKCAKELLVQFQVKFYDIAKRRFILRVTTVRRATTLAILESHKVSLSNGKHKLVHLKSNIIKEKMVLESFNAKVWTCLATRLLITRIDTPVGYEPIEDILKEAEKDMIRLLHNFGGIDIKHTQSGVNPYENLTLSYSIHANFKELPSYAYNLHRNHQLTRIFNCSPDETAFYHHVFKSLGVEESDIMVRPKLYRVVLDSLEETNLDWESMGSVQAQSQYFVMDGLSTIVIFKRLGNSNEKLPLHPSNNDEIIFKSPELSEVGSVIQLVNENILKTRSFIPKIILTQSGHSQARFLQAWLQTNPSQRHQGSKPKKWYSVFTGTPKPPKPLPNEMTIEEFCEDFLDKVRIHKQNML